MYRSRWKGSQKFNERMARWREIQLRKKLEIIMSGPLLASLGITLFMCGFALGLGVKMYEERHSDSKQSHGKSNDVNSMSKPKSPDSPFQ